MPAVSVIVAPGAPVRLDAESSGAGGFMTESMAERPESGVNAPGGANSAQARSRSRKAARVPVMTPLVPIAPIAA